MTTVLHWPADVATIPGFVASEIPVLRSGDVVWGGDGTTLITASKNTIVGFPGGSFIFPCPGGGAAIVIKPAVSFGIPAGEAGNFFRYTIPDLTALFSTPWVGYSVDVPTFGVGFSIVGQGGCDQPWLGNPPGASWEIRGNAADDFQVIFDEDYGNPTSGGIFIPAGTVLSFDEIGQGGVVQNADFEFMQYHYQHNWSQFPGEPITPFPSDISYPASTFLGISTPGGFPQYSLALTSGGFNGIIMNINQFAWWTDDATTPEIPVDPPNVELTPPPLPSCSATRINIGGASAGTVPD